MLRLANKYALLPALAIAIMMAAAPSYAQVNCASHGDTSNPQTATCNGYWGASELAPSTSITIYQATDQGALQCRTIKNLDPVNSYFVPWQRPHEWTEFLSAAETSLQSKFLVSDQYKCCIPVKITSIQCTNGNTGGVTTKTLLKPIWLDSSSLGTPIGVPSSSPVPALTIAQPTLLSSIFSPTQVDASYVGFTLDSTLTVTPNPQVNPDHIPSNHPEDLYYLGYWGAHGDARQYTFQSTDFVSGDTSDTTNFTVNWSCDTTKVNPATLQPAFNDPTQITQGYGGWVQTHTTGSCVPSNGACGGAGGASFPANTPLTVTSRNLCEVGSVLAPGSFQSTPTGWQWTCNGTGGTGCSGNPNGQCLNAACTATLGSANGTCGSDNGRQFTLPAQPPTNAPTSLCSSGTPSTVSAGNAQGFYYQWTCTGSNGSTTSCGASNGLVNAQCANLDALNNGAGYNDAQMLAYQAQCNSGSGCPLCTAGVLDPNLGVWDGGGTQSTWQWGCDGSGGGINQYCRAVNATIVAYCGANNGVAFGSSNSLNANSPNLCQNNEAVTNFLFTPNSSGSGGEYTWTCNSDGTTAACSALFVNSPTFFQGQCGGDEWAYFCPNEPTASGLCSVGTPINLQVAGEDPARTGCTPNVDASGWWSWYCVGSNPNDQNTWSSQCNANHFSPQPTTTATPVSGTCSTAPGNCAYGSPTGYSCDSNNNCSWQCQGDAGTSAASCGSQGAPVQTENGVCGAANNEPTSTPPNVNLCISGVASGVTPVGTTSYNWRCNGTGNDSGQSQDCSANQCSQCTGSITRNNSAARNGSVGSCGISGTANWMETYNLSPSGSAAAQISWTDPMGTFQDFVPSSSATSMGSPTYCPPCYLQLSHVSHASVTISSTSGSCSSPYTVGGVLTPSNVSP